MPAFTFRLAPGLAILLLFVGCYLPQEEEIKGIQLDLNDPLSQHIIDLQDQQLTDSLLLYLSHKNPTYRYLAARSFGSIIDPTVVDSLSSLLQDPYDLVRQMAAYGLGQQGDIAAIPTLKAAFTGGAEANLFQRANGAILEAVGRLGELEELDLLSDISTYDSADTALISGQARAILRMGMRDFHSIEATTVQVNIATKDEAPLSAKGPAAVYLARYAPSLNQEQQQQISEELLASADGEVAQMLSRAIARLGDDNYHALVREQLSANDWRVQVMTLSGLSEEDYPVMQSAVRKVLKGSNHLASVAAAEYYLRAGLAQDATGYAKLAQDSLSGRVRYLMYAAAQRHLPYYLADYRTSINYELQQQFEQATDPYEQANILQALAEFPWNYRIIHNLGFGHPDPVVRTAAASAIGLIANFDGFADFFTVSQRRVRTEISVYLREAITSEDPGMVAEAALAIKEAGAIFQPLYTDLEWAQTALANLVLPRDTESHRTLDDAIAVLEGRNPTDPHPAPAYNHPIDWSVIKAAGSAPVVRFRTTKGNISLLLFPEAAPGTVAAFVQLVNDGFYNDKAIHRVVPAWVAQGGDPRGDGYGSTGFSLRTETPPLYYDRAGLLGVASAGRDTEGGQFFITHGIACQLDGRYTIFGEVLEGQDIVDQLQVGDRIERAELR